MAPGRIKFRRTKKTILIVGEGETEKAFLQHLKECFISRDSDIHVKVECGSGGDPKSVIQKTIRLRGSRSYDECFVLIDSDRTVQLDARLRIRMERKPRVIILHATPCLEGLLLAIVGHPNFSQTGSISNYCKQEFENNHIPSGKKTDKRSYGLKFSKEVVEQRRVSVPELDAILRAMKI